MMKNVVTIKSDLNYEVIDSILNNSYQELVIHIPKVFKNTKFGLLPIFLQAISSFFINNQKVNIVIKSMHASDIDHLSKELIYLAFILRSKDLLNEQEESFFKQFIDKAIVFLDYMQDVNNIQKTFKGMGTQYICFDWSRNFSYIHTLYNGDKLITKNEFINLFAEKIFDNSTPQVYRHAKLQFTNDFGSIIFELFQNTEEHARNNSLDRKSIRGFTTKHLLIKPVEIKSHYSHIKNYLNIFHIENKGLQFIEISVFDTGDGLAKSLNKDDLDNSFETEKTYVLKCFNKHITSKTNKMYGIGLYDVIKKIILNRGLFILRTGRIHLEVNYSQIDINEDIVIFNIPIEEQLPIIGTSFTIILPLSLHGVSH